MNGKLNILIAPLDWGLGHATRCIPIIKALLPYGQISVTVTPVQRALLQGEALDVRYINLPGYGITYSRHGWKLPFKLVAQVPQLLTAIRKEHKWLHKMNRQEAFDIVISDNRYGLSDKASYCVFMTHQLTIKAPFGWLEKLLRKLNYRFINRYHECWVPDFAGSQNISGVLGHPPELPETTINYIGPLSRFEPGGNAAPKYQWLFLVSGPEPQRTAFEEKILAVKDLLPGKKLLVRGLPDNSLDTLPLSGDLTTRNHLTGLHLREAIEASEMVVCRAGYTSIMELIALQKKAVLIATPGQTEQEYLAEQLAANKWFGTASQEDTDTMFAERLLIASKKHFNFPVNEPADLPAFLSGFINRVKARQR